MQKKIQPRVSFELIEAAMKCDPVAIEEVLKVFWREIGFFSVSKNREGEWEKDEDLEDYIIQNLFLAISRFRIC